uniref:Uncharacterized protein n=1 Tax=Arundo donax TaxID=35708 RepID=A0A0A8Y140_ARUDO
MLGIKIISLQKNRTFQQGTKFSFALLRL